MTPLNNINFQILLNQHGGDVARATLAWEKILSLGKFGAVPANYSGGLDIGGLRVMVDEVKQGDYRRHNPLASYPGQPEYLTDALVGEDELHQIEDIAAGDKIN